MKTQKVFMAIFTALIVFCFSGCGSSTSDTTSDGDAVMSSFSAKTLDGSTFTQDDLANYDLTMVNIWTTWCSYCVSEMPELQDVYENLPDNVNMITICCDADSESDTAKEIISENGCTFPVLIPDDQLTTSLLNTVTGYPTTVFVDKDGNMVGAAQVGVPSTSDTADAYLDLINDRLEQLD